MFLKALFYFLCIALICEAAFVDHLNKCSIKDGRCHKKLFQTVLRDIGKTGIPELGIPATDPFVVKNISVAVLNLIEIGMDDGVAKGIKDCVVEKFETHLEKERASMELTCDLTIKGKYRVRTLSPLVENLLGTTIQGDGVAKVVIDKLHLKLDFHFYVRDEGDELYIACHDKEWKYDYSIGNMSFAVNDLYFGDQDASGPVNSMLNENWRFLMDTFGQSFIDTAIGIVYKQTHKFFDVVPLKHYIIEDLSSFAKNKSE